MQASAQAWSALGAAGDVFSVGRVVRTEAHRLARSQGATFVLAEGDQCFYEDADAIEPLRKGQRFLASTA